MVLQLSLQMKGNYHSKSVFPNFFHPTAHQLNAEQGGVSGKRSNAGVGGGERPNIEWAQKGGGG